MKTIKTEDIAKPYDVAEVDIPMHASYLPHELPALHGILSRASGIKTGRLLEIGTHFGCGVVQYRKMFPGLEIHTLNILPEQVMQPPAQGEIIPREKIGWFARGRRVEFTQKYGDSWRFEFGCRHYDAIIIDGNHGSEYVKRDSIRAIPAVKPGGVIVWHDYNTESAIGKGVKSAVDLVDLGMLNETCVHVEGTWLVFFQQPG